MPRVRVLPVGLTLSFRKDVFPEEFANPDIKPEVTLYGMEDIEHAVEAGPMLLSEGKICINMKLEGWKTHNSVITQAGTVQLKGSV